MVRVQYRPLMSQACTRKGLHRDAQPCLSPGPAAFAEGCCMLVPLGAAPHFAPWMHRILHRFFGRPLWDSQPEHSPRWFESNHQFRLLLEHANLYVSNNGELRLTGCDPTNLIVAESLCSVLSARTMMSRRLVRGFMVDVKCPARLRR